MGFESDSAVFEGTLSAGGMPESGRECNRGGDEFDVRLGDATE
jgi:hypothetical protein